MQEARAHVPVAALRSGTRGFFSPFVPSRFQPRHFNARLGHSETGTQAGGPRSWRASVVLCPSCATENPDGAKFCSGCAMSLQSDVTCPSCGTPNAPGSRFCNECAQSLAETLSPPRTPTPAPSRALPAAFAGGRYRVKRFLGEGGRKRVYLAHDTKLDRDVAIAVIKTEGLDEAGLARVQREAQAMGRLGDHPHIVTVFDIGDEGGQPYIVSQYMAGGDLEGLLQRAENRRLSINQAVLIANQIRQALEHAHSRGIIHRDLKPGNIWLTQEGTAKLGDF